MNAVIGGVVEFLFFLVFLYVVAYRLLLGTFFKLVTVPGTQVGVIMRDGKVLRVVGSGRHWVSAKKSIVACDMRPKPIRIQNQNLIALDGMGMLMSLGGEAIINDPAAYLIGSSDSTAALYLEIQLALKTAVSEFQSTWILDGDAPVVQRVRELATPRANQLGITITNLAISEALPIGWRRVVEDSGTNQLN